MHYPNDMFRKDDRRKQPRADTVNRRAFPRWHVPCEVRYGTGSNLSSGEAIEIGEGGLSLQTDSSFPIETNIDVEFRLTKTDSWIKVKAIVRHSQGGKLGLEFLNLRIADRLRIVDFMSVPR